MYYNTGHQIKVMFKNSRVIIRNSLLIIMPEYLPQFSVSYQSLHFRFRKLDWNFIRSLPDGIFDDLFNLQTL